MEYSISVVTSGSKTESNSSVDCTVNVCYGSVMETLSVLFLLL